MGNGVERSAGSASSGVLVALLILCLLGAAFAIVAPRFLRSTSHGGNETSVIATLRNLPRCQEEFRKGKFVDLDRDGIGEFGTFGEMTGGASLRTAADASTRGERVRPPLLGPSMAGVTRAGIVTKSGYAFRLFLPGAQGGAVREERSDSLYRRGECIDCVGKPRGAPCGRCGELAAPFTGPVDVDGAETRWCAYAWPVAHGNSGNRAFFVDQGGEVRWTANEKGRYSGVEFGPAWDAAMPVPGRDRAPTDPKAREYRGRDGGLWTRTH